MNVALCNAVVTAYRNYMNHAVGRVNLLTRNSYKSGINAAVSLVYLTARLEAVVIGKGNEIVSLLSVVTRLCGSISRSVGAAAVRMKIALKRNALV